jgi:hypothetical protein
MFIYFMSKLREVWTDRLLAHWRSVCTLFTERVWLLVLITKFVIGVVFLRNTSSSGCTLPRWGIEPHTSHCSLLGLGLPVGRHLYGVIEVSTAGFTILLPCVEFSNSHVLLVCLLPMFFIITYGGGHPTTHFPVTTMTSAPSTLQPVDSAVTQYPVN